LQHLRDKIRLSWLMLGVDIYPSKPELKPKDVPANYVLVEVYARCARCTYQQELVFIGWQYLDASWVTWLHPPHPGSRL